MTPPRPLTRRLLSSKMIPALFVGMVISPSPAHAAVDPETAYIFNSLLFLIGGILVMWMAAGFSMLEAGLVRSKNVAEICLKNISLYSIAGVMYFLIGYNLMYVGVDGGFFGTFSSWSANDALALDAAADFAAMPYASASDWFFQMVFVATAASVVSGTMAERVKIVPFLTFVVILTGLIYPIQGAWKWGGGWLDVMGFQDFAGSTLVHSVGGWAALTGAIILGPRRDKYDKAGRVKPVPGSSLPLATLGTFILWMGWFGFNGASQLALGSAIDAIAVAQIFANTNMAAAGGVIAAMAASKTLYKKFDLTLALNGALAGLVSITAEPLTPTVGEAILIGAVGGVIVVFGVTFLDKMKIDDVVGAIPVHLMAGIWGTMAVAFTNSDASFTGQIIGVSAIGTFVLVASAIAWTVIKRVMGIRLSAEDEFIGGDMAELGLEAYPEFGHGSQKLRG